MSNKLVKQRVNYRSQHVKEHLLKEVQLHLVPKKLHLPADLMANLPPNKNELSSFSLPILGRFSKQAKK